MVAETCSSPVPNSVSVSVADQLLQPAAASSRDLKATGDNGSNGKESPRDEVSDLLERWELSA